VFGDRTPAELIRGRLWHASAELETTHAQLHVANQELRASSDRLHATVKQLDTKRGQLRAVNRRRETMDEMRQATGQELDTVNGQLHGLVDELSQVHRLLETLVCGPGTAIVVLDRDQKVRFCGGANALWGLSSGEMIGRYFGDLETGLPVSLLSLVRACWTGESTPREVVVPAIDRGGRTIECRITLRPLVADGVVHAVMMIQHARPVS
jgi:two-component system CheB/CheR fusion protein